MKYFINLIVLLTFVGCKNKDSKVFKTLSFPELCFNLESDTLIYGNKYEAILSLSDTVFFQVGMGGGKEYNIIPRYFINNKLLQDSNKNNYEFFKIKDFDNSYEGYFNIIPDSLEKEIEYKRIWCEVEFPHPNNGKGVVKLGTNFGYWIKKE